MLKMIFTPFLLVTLALTACQPITLVQELEEPTAVAVEEAMAASTDNILLGIVNAPTSPGGTVADLPTAINILMNAPSTADQYFSDPAHFGHQIPAGGWMEIELGGSYVRNGVDNNAEFVPVNSNTNLILLTGNAQNGLAAAAGDGPQHANYSIEDDGNKILTVRPNGGRGAMGLEGARAQEIGLKVIHLLPNFGSNTGPAPFQNGPAGSEGTVALRIYDASGTLMESGTAALEFPVAIGRQVFVTNLGLVTPMQFSPDVITEFNEMTNFQHVAPGTQLVNTTKGETFAAGMPYALRFLLVESAEAQPDPYGPMIGIPDVGLIVNADAPATATLVQDANSDGALDDSDTVVGQVAVEGPTAESQGSILAMPEWPLTVSGDGLEGSYGSFLNVAIEVGNEAGVYATTVTLESGSTATIYTVVE